jgi:hypothetical protein
MEQSMTKLTSIDRKACSVLRDALQAAVSGVAEQYGVSINVGNASYSSNEVTFKTSAAIISADGIAETETRSDLKRFYPAMVDHVFTSRGTEYKVVGYRYKASKNRWMAERTRDGKTFVGPDSWVKFDEDTGAPRQPADLTIA